MFLGISTVNVDNKGRIAVPTRCREAMALVSEAGQAILTIDIHDRCLLLYTLNYWAEIQVKVQDLPNFSNTARRIQRILIGHATPVELDTQGRILLPPVLRDYAKISKRVIMVGQGKKFELWDETLWQQQRDVWLQGSDDENDIPPEIRSLSL